MKDSKTSNSIALLIGVICIFIILFGTKLLPIAFFYAEIVSYLVCLILIILTLKYVLGFNLNDHFFTITTKDEDSFLKKFPFLFGLSIGVIYSLFLILIAKSGINDIWGNKKINLFESLSIALIGAPIIEEVLFRGYIQGIIKSKFFSDKKERIAFWFPIFITSFVFASLHLLNYKAITSIQLVLTFALSISIALLCGYLRSKYNHIKYSIKVHIGANLGGVIAIPIALLLGIAPKSGISDTSMRTEFYHFNMNSKESEFYDELSRFFRTELELNNN